MGILVDKGGAGLVSSPLHAWSDDCGAPVLPCTVLVLVSDRRGVCHGLTWPQRQRVFPSLFSRRLKRLFYFVPKPLLCATVTADTTAELRQRRDEVTEADLIELRLDSVADPDVAGALAGRRRPVVLTCRPTWEGGRFKGSEEERKAILAQAYASGAEFVDIEWRAGFDDLIARCGGRRVVLSIHDFRGIPDDLGGLLQAMRGTGAEVLKIALTPTELSDCLTLVDVGVQQLRRGELVLIGLGDYGLITRVLAGRFGSRWTYAGGLREIGQLSLRALVEEYRFRLIGDDTHVYGLVGGSVGYSVSPAMHNAAFRAAGIDAVYVPMPARTADDFLRFASAFGVKGASVTIPHKVSLCERVDEVDAASRQIGAINTIRAGGACWEGRNTDVQGFLRPLKERVPESELPRLRVSILGAGGSARAVAAALTSCGCAVRLHARDRSRAGQTAALVSGEAGPWPPAPGSWDLLINCTPVGMFPRSEATPVPAADLTGRYVYDLVYNPPVTRLLQEAASAGCRTIGGLDMLVEQAQDQFRWWTGVNPAPGVMRAAALERLAEFARDETYIV
jgi:3-dehydroquinate dehydratase/shikimate dehydrogenase